MHQLEQLLLTCLTANHVDLVSMLVLKAPAVAMLDESRVARLLQVAALLGNHTGTDYNLNIWGNSQDISALDVLCRLPAAKFVSGPTIVSVVRMLLFGTDAVEATRECSSLLKLPGADSIDSSQLCSLLALVLDKRAYCIIKPLAGLAERQGMPHNGVLQVVTGLLAERPMVQFVQILEHLQPFKLWTHMGDAEVVDLLVQVASNSPSSEYIRTEEADAAEVLRLAMDALRANSRKFTDVGSFLRLCKAIFKTWYSEENEELFEDIFDKTHFAAMRPAAMNQQDCIELVRYCIIEKGFVPDPLLQLPGVQKSRPAEVYALMQLCLQDMPPRSPGHVSDYSRSYDSDYDPDELQSPAPEAAVSLAQLPGARKFSVQQVADILHLHMHREGTPDRDALSDLLALPAAQQISADVAEGLLSAAFKGGSMQAIKVLCQRLPICAAAWERMEPQVLLQRLETLLQETGSAKHNVLQQHEFRDLLKHPSLQQKAQEVLPELLLAGFAAAMTSKQFAAKYWELPKPQLITGELREVLQLPAAQTLSAAVLKQLMQHSITQLGGALLSELVRLPAASQLQQADVAVLLQAVLKCSCPKKSSSLNTSGALSESGAAVQAAPPAAPLGGQQAAPHQQLTSQRRLGAQQQQQQQLGQQEQRQQQQAKQEQELEQTSAVGSQCSSVSALLQQCLQQRKAAPQMFQLLTLPWVQQLPAAALKGFLVSAAERQYKALFHWLLQQPQAPRDDAEVQGYVDLLRFSGGSADDPFSWVGGDQQDSPRQQQQGRRQDSCSDPLEDTSSDSDELNEGGDSDEIEWHVIPSSDS